MNKTLKVGWETTSPIFMYGTRKGDKMGRKAKCRVCGESLDTTTAFKLIEHDTNNKAKTSYYCNREEYEKSEAEKRENEDNKNKAYSLICDIIGREKIANTILWREWKEWNKAFSNKTIASYLEENKEYLTSTISRLEDKEFNRIRYLSAILKNSLGDFKQKEKEVEKPKVQVDETFYESVPTTQNKRRALADLEDEF